MTRGIELAWDSKAGMVQIRLPSGTRLNISRENPAFLWNFMDALTQLNERDPKYLLTPMTEKQFRAIFTRWKANGNRQLEIALEAMEPRARDRLTNEQIETMRLAKMAEGYCVIKPTKDFKKPPKDLDLSQLEITEPLNLEGLL